MIGGGSEVLVVLVVLLLVGAFVLLPVLLLRGATRRVAPSGWSPQYRRAPSPGPDPRARQAVDPRGWDSGSVPAGPPVVAADVVSLRDRLGHDVRVLEPGDDPVARQAMADASERYAMCSALLERAGSPAQLTTAWHAAVEGLTAARVVRQRLGLDAGPAIPLPPGPGPQLTHRARVDVGGTEHVGAPQYEPGRPHWFPGGVYGGRPVPGGWYGVPFWESAVLGGAVHGLLGGLALSSLLGGWGPDGGGTEGGAPDAGPPDGGGGDGWGSGESGGAGFGGDDAGGAGWGGWGGGGDGGGGGFGGGGDFGGGGGW